MRELNHVLISNHIQLMKDTHMFWLMFFEAFTYQTYFSLNFTLIYKLIQTRKESRQSLMAPLSTNHRVSGTFFEVAYIKNEAT